MSAKSRPRTALRKAMVAAIARIAQHACREGEKGGRHWPPLRTLPFRQSWECVGETYADEVLAELFAVALAESIGADHDRA